MTTMMSNGDVNGRRRKGDHQEEEEEAAAAFMKDYPAGYKFRPTDEELIKYYLYPKIKKLSLPRNIIKDVNNYSYNPWDFTETYGTNYFFTPRERKYSKGDLPNGAAKGGYWMFTNEIPIIDDDMDKVIGYKRVLDFELRKPSKEDSKMNEILKENQTGWYMHEYTLKKDKGKNKSPWTEAGGLNNNQLDEFVLRKIAKSKPPKSRKRRAAGAAAPAPSIVTTPSAAVAAAVPQNHHQMHHYPLNSAAAAEEMMPRNHHYMCRTDVAAAADHRYSLTSMILEATAPPEEMMSFNHNYYYSDNVNPSSSSAILPPANQHYYGEMMNQQQLQSAMLPSVIQHYYGEMNQQQLQSAMLPSVNQHYYSEMNQQQLQSAMLPSVNQHYYDEMNQQQLQPEILPSVNYHTDDQMNEQQLQPAVLPSVNHHTDGQMTQEQLQEESDWAMLAAAWNNDTDFFLKLRERRENKNSPQLHCQDPIDNQEEARTQLITKASIDYLTRSQQDQRIIPIPNPTFLVQQASFSSLPGERTNIGPR